MSPGQTSKLECISTRQMIWGCRLDREKVGLDERVVSKATVLSAYPNKLMRKNAH